MEEKIEFVKTDPALPCATVKDWQNDRRCGMPATVSFANLQSDGTWLLLPRCEICTLEVAWVYQEAPKRGEE